MRSGRRKVYIEFPTSIAKGVGFAPKNAPRRPFPW
jgi:hypothetical protein